jgi:arylsulfatase
VDETGLKGDAQPPLPLVDAGQVVERVKAAQQHTFTRRYTERAVSFIREHQKQPFFIYLPHNAVHFPDYPHQDFMGKSGVSLQKDWTLEVDWSVGQILATLRELKLDSNTLVIFTSDNGGPINQGADNTPLRGGKGTTFEGGMRVCTLAWWPGKIQSASSTAAITSHMDWLPTFAAIAGEPAIKDKLLKGTTLNGRPYRNIVDGYDLDDYLTGKADTSPRNAFIYPTDAAEICAVRVGDWKTVYLENRGVGFEVWREPMAKLRVPLLFNLRRDPFERAQHNASVYNDWMQAKNFRVSEAQAVAMQFLQSLKDFPPSQKPGSWDLDNARQRILEASATEN